MSLISINRLTNVALSTCVKNTFCINKLKNSAEKDIYIHIHISSMPFLKGIFFSILSMSYITITWYFRELILQNQRVKELFELEGNFKDHLFQLPFTQQGHPQLDRLLRVLSSLALDVSRDRASIVSLGNLFQWLTTLTVKDFFLFFSKLNSPSSFSLSLQGKCSISWIIFVALLWKYSSRSTSLPYWGLPMWTQYSMWVLTSTGDLSRWHPTLGYVDCNAHLGVLHRPVETLSILNPTDKDAKEH